MGCGGTNPDENLLSLMNEAEEKLIQAAVPRYTYLKLGITLQPDGVHAEGTSLVMSGNDIRSHLEGCSEAVLLCATLSENTDKLIRIAQLRDMTEALVLDAMSSAAVEQLCSKLETELHTLYPEKYFTWRFSPGYGDFPLEAQRSFISVLNANKRIGLYLTDSLMLTPLKSVTAVIGLSDSPLPQKKRGCVTCNMRERCLFRKGGGHCSY